jgi:hypothetical protein
MNAMNTMKTECRVIWMGDSSVVAINGRTRVINKASSELGIETSHLGIDC